MLTLLITTCPYIFVQSGSGNYNSYKKAGCIITLVIGLSEFLQYNEGKKVYHINTGMYDKNGDGGGRGSTQDEFQKWINKKYTVMT